MARLKDKANNKKNDTAEASPPGGSKKPLLFLVSIKEKIFLAKHLAVMIKAGIPIHEALEALLEQATTPSLRHVLSTCIRDLEGGQVLRHCLEKFPRVFDPFFSNVIGVGETSGTLAESLQYLSAQLEKSRELQGKVRSALFYPIIVFVGAIGIGVYLAFFLLPKLTPLFASFSTELPTTTRWLLGFTGFIRTKWPLVLIALGVVIVTSVALWRIKSVRVVIHGIFLRLPIFGALIVKIQITQFARILGTLLNAGVKVVPALRITSGSLKNLIYQRELAEVADEVERGGALADALKERKHLFDRTTISMVRVGENTGKLSESLLALAAFTEGELDHDIENLSSLIEPVVLVVVGIIVSFVALSIITPIYQLTQSVSERK